MKIKNLVMCVLILPFFIKAQWPAPLNLNTATNPANTGTIAVNATDANWQSSLTGLTSGYSGAVAVAPVTPSLGGWFAPAQTANASWISYRHNCAGNLYQSESWCLGGDIEEYYKVSVTLPATVGTYALNYKIYADNCVYKIYLNNTSTALYTAPPGNYYWQYGFTTPIMGTINSGWVAGVNTLYLHVKSSANANSDGYTGVLFEATGTFTPGLENALTEQPARQQAELAQNYPNPFQENTRITYRIPGSFSQAQLNIMSIDGRVVRMFPVATNEGNVVISTGELGKGLYFYSLIVDGRAGASKKMLND